MKHTALVGIAVLCTPLTGCGALGSLFDSQPQTQMLAPAKQAAPGTGALPTDIDGAIRSAQDARKNGQLEVATKMLSQIMLVAPDDPRVLGEYGKALAAQGRTDDAIAFLERATQLQSDDWTLFSAQGVAYDQKGNYKAAQASYARALALKPGEPTVLNNDALSHALSGDLDGAEELLRSAGPAAQSDPRLAKNLELVRSLKEARAGMAAPVLAQAAVKPAPAFTQTPAPAPVAMDYPAPATQAPTEVPRQLASAGQTPDPSANDEQVAAPLPFEAVTLAQTPADTAVVMQPLPVEKSEELPPPAPPKPEMTAQIEHKTTRTPLAAPAAEPTAPPVRIAAVSKTYFVQAGAFGTEVRADKAASGLESLGARVMPGSAADGHAVYRVRIGPFLNRQQANVAIGQAHALGHADVIIVAE